MTGSDRPDEVQRSQIIDSCNQEIPAISPLKRFADGLQGLITQYRSKMLNYRQQYRRPFNDLPTGRDTHEELRRLQSLNVSVT